MPVLINWSRTQRISRTEPIHPAKGSTGTAPVSLVDAGAFLSFTCKHILYYKELRSRGLIWCTLSVSFHKFGQIDSIIDHLAVIVYCATFVVHPQFMAYDLSLMPLGTQTR
jgi:hypothetical protein